MNFSRILAPLLGVLLVVLGGCEKKPEEKPLEIDQKFSVNVIPIPHYWPREKFDWPTSPVERNIRQEAWAKYGTPDFLRRIYTFDNRIVRPLELSEGHVLAGKRPVPLDQWVYIEEDRTITFTGPRMELGTIPDQIRIVCLNGDPNEVKEFPRADFTMVSFFYYNQGKEYVFMDGKLWKEVRHSDPIYGAEIK